MVLRHKTTDQKGYAFINWKRTWNNHINHRNDCSWWAWDLKFISYLLISEQFLLLKIKYAITVVSIKISWETLTYIWTLLFFFCLLSLLLLLLVLFKIKSKNREIKLQRQKVYSDYRKGWIVKAMSRGNYCQ